MFEKATQKTAKKVLNLGIQQSKPLGKQAGMQLGARKIINILLKKGKITTKEANNLLVDLEVYSK